MGDALDGEELRKRVEAYEEADDEIKPDESRQLVLVHEKDEGEEEEEGVVDNLEDPFAAFEIRPNGLGGIFSQQSRYKQDEREGDERECDRPLQFARQNGDLCSPVLGKEYMEHQKEESAFDDDPEVDRLQADEWEEPVGWKGEGRAHKERSHDKWREKGKLDAPL